MTEQSRIITEEQWKEYRQLLCLRRQWERERQELEEQLKEANEVINVFRKENWRYGGEFIGVLGSYSCAQSYLDKWGVK